MQISIYRVDANKIRHLADFELNEFFYRHVHTEETFSRFSTDLYHRVRAKHEPWDKYVDYFDNMYAYVAYDEKGRVVTPDRLLGLYRKWLRQRYAEFDKTWKYGRRQPGSKRRPYCWHRHPKTTQLRRWYHAWDDEEFAPRPRAGRSPKYLPSAWDDVRRSDKEDRNWKRHRKTQWKENKLPK